MKRVISLILATIMAFGMVACAQNGASNNGASTDASSNSGTGNNTTNDTSSNASSSHPYLTTVPEDTKLKMGFVVMDISNPYFVESVKGTQAFADRHGYDLTVIDGGSNAEKQVTGMENLITKGIDACDMRAVDSAAMTDIVKAAAESGMALCTYPEYPEMTSTMTYDDYAQGSALAKTAAEWINTKLNGTAEVALLTQPSSETIRQRVAAFYDVLEAEAPNATVVAEQEGFTSEDGMSVTESILQAHPDVKVILCINDSGALGAYEAVVGAGKATDDFFIGGIDGDASALAKIADGTIYRASVASKMLTSEVAYYIQRNMARAKLGLEYEEKMVFEVFSITKENVEEYLAKTPDYDAIDNMK